MNKIILIAVLFFNFQSFTFGQQIPLKNQIDSLILKDAKKPFNGIILIKQKGEIKYSQKYGFSNIDKKLPFKQDDQFVIGSISKQFTAVIVLQELEKGHLMLSDPISKYLPKIKKSWADSVTINHLILHMHGIQSLDMPLMYEPGSKFDYNLANLGFNLLSKIVEKTSGKSFANLSAELFKQCEMNNTFHPSLKKYKQLVKGYTEQKNGELKYEKSSLAYAPAAGGFISTVEDLEKWNTYLHHGKLLKPETYTLMVTKQPNAIRNHPLFSTTEYGYGITISTTDGLLQLGQTGFAPGFGSMNFYFPKTETSVIVLQNIAYNTNNLNTTFFYHIEILKIIREELKQISYTSY